MALEDWVFLSEGVSSNIIQIINDDTPLLGTGSLQVEETLTPDESSALWSLSSEIFPKGLLAGKLRTIFSHGSGMGFRQHGCFFLSSTLDPLSAGACYAVVLPDGGSTLKLMKYADRLLGPGEVLYEVMSPMLPEATTPLIIEVTWYSGIFTDRYGGARIEVALGLDTTDENDLVPLFMYIDENNPFLLSMNEGFFSASRMSLEPLFCLCDHTRITAISARG